jgi:alkylation response protein AidB-like acyl-CoA dehydrogenase
MAIPGERRSSVRLGKQRHTKGNSMTESLMVTDGHVAPAGLDPDTLVMMLDALGEFVSHALPAKLQLELDHDDICPEDTVRAMSDPGQLGVQLLFVPGAYGGMDGGAFDSYRVCEVMARHDIGLATACSPPSSAVIRSWSAPPRSRSSAGSVRSRKRVVVFAYGATEPDAGSDLGALKTVAERIEEDGVVTGYRINGRKQWISNGSIADFSHDPGPHARRALVVHRRRRARRASRRPPRGQARPALVQHRRAVPRRRRGARRSPDRWRRRQRAWCRRSRCSATPA